MLSPKTYGVFVVCCLVWVFCCFLFGCFWFCFVVALVCLLYFWGFFKYIDVARNYVPVNSGTWLLNKLTGIETSYSMQPNSPIYSHVIYKPAKQMLLF